MNQKVKLTKSVVDHTTFPPAGQFFLRDSELNGFALRLTPGAKSFILEKRIHGKVKRITLGRYPEITVEQARKEAHKWLGQIATGGTRAWYRVERRQTVIKPHQLAAWYGAVIGLKEEGNSPQSAAIADYLLLLLFTGLRRQEAAQLEWSRVDLKHRTLTIQDTKNREPLTLPLSGFLVALLKAREKLATGRYVFPGEGKAGYLVEPRKQMTKVMIHSGVEFTLHDLRRTFITVAESLDISAYALKRLVNHKMSGDVTAGYIVADVERLREPVQKIADYLLSSCSNGIQCLSTADKVSDAS